MSTATYESFGLSQWQRENGKRFPVDGGEVMRVPLDQARPEHAKYELLAQDGFRFAGDTCHSYIGYDAADIRDQMKGASLEPCPDDCACGE